MDTKDILTILGTGITAVSVVIGYLKYRLDKMMAIQNRLPKIAKPHVMIKHTETTCNGRPTLSTLTIEIANRDNQDISIKSIHWWVESLRTRWDITPNNKSPNTIEQLPHKLATSELYQLISNADYPDFASILGPLNDMKDLECSMSICNLSIEVTLTTGECIILRAPWTLRDNLIDYHSHPHFLKTFFKWYIRRHP